MLPARWGGNGVLWVLGQNPRHAALRRLPLQEWSRTPPARRAGSGLLALNFAGAVVMALRMPHAFRVPLLVGAQVLFAAYLYWETAHVDAAR